uniref:Uncharacterized protein n=1 Tax=Anguilla anguilla TaxID=7936 RepID=A0A0E9RQC0_ANGAN
MLRHWHKTQERGMCLGKVSDAVVKSWRTTMFASFMVPFNQLPIKAFGIRHVDFVAKKQLK